MAVSSFLKRVLIFLAGFAVLNLGNATQVMHRPANVSAPLREFKLEEMPIVHVIEKRATAKVSMAYFTNWGIYAATDRYCRLDPYPWATKIYHHIPYPIPVPDVLYSFADVNPSSGVIALTDPYADEQKHYPTDSWSETGNNLYGCLKQLYLLKLANRNLKVMLSIGGWTYSQAGHFAFVTNAAARATFVSGAVQLIEDYGFDGIDLDFEYPANAAQGQGFADLFTALRTAFDALAARKGDANTYLLSVAVSAGPANYANLIVPQMDKALTFWNLMAYDYAGSWLTFSDNQANLYGGARTGVSTDAAIKHFLSSGATASKINMGIPLYGRAFEQTAGLGQPYNGIGPGTIEAGVYSYKALPIAGAKIIEDTSDVASYSYDSSSKELVSYDTPAIVKLKAQYTIANGLSGSMFWELSQDKKGADSLVGTSAAVLGALDQTKNHINFPNSKWDNIKSNMGQGSAGGGGGGTGTTTTPVTTTTTTTTTTGGGTSTGTPGSGICSGVAAWVSTSVYTGGLQATYGGHLWTAKWWTTNDTPGGAAGVWTDNGAC
ncbi:glycosyl hydrolases family 18-domain-containing protein [Mycena latifolia]|nr:glycosyl hydrolases family 18-domain-containing protein [Mycena latifolia]